jgi:hypothetical protein
MRTIIKFNGDNYDVSSLSGIDYGEKCLGPGTWHGTKGGIWKVGCDYGVTLGQSARGWEEFCKTGNPFADPCIVNCGIWSSKKHPPRPSFPPPPKQDPPLPESKIKKVFGNPGDGIVEVELPLIGKIKCHEKIAESLIKVFKDIEKAELNYRIKFNGCYNKRRMYCKVHKAYCNHMPWSHHAWGIAIDLNADTNEYGKKGDMPQEIVDIFKKHGFIWGGYWESLDPMHFEYVGEYGKCKGKGC